MQYRFDLDGAIGTKGILAPASRFTRQQAGKDYYAVMLVMLM